MTTDLEARLEAAFAERAATTPVNAPDGSMTVIDFADASRHRGRALLLAAGVIAASLVAGLVVLRPEPVDRVVSSPGFDGSPLPLATGRFVSLGLPAAEGWTRTATEDISSVSSVSYCRSLDNEGVCGDVVGSTGVRYERDGHEVEIVNLFGPEATTSIAWQAARVGTPVRVRGSDAGFEVSHSDTTSVWLAWSESPQHHVLLIDHSPGLTADTAIEAAEQLAPTDLRVRPQLVEVASIDTDDRDRTAVGPGLMSLVAGRIDGRTCVALLGFNGNETCGAGFDYGDGPKSAVAGRDPGAGGAVVAAILPSATQRVIVDLYESGPMTFDPITVSGLDERFLLASVGTVFPTTVRALDADGAEIAAYQVDPLFGSGFARGTIDGKTWDLSEVNSCVFLQDVYGSAEDCADPNSLPTAAITVGTATPTLQFGRAGSDVAAVEVDGVQYPIHRDPSGRGYWVAPLTGLPTPTGPDGTPLDQQPLGMPAPDPNFCAAAVEATQLSDIELLNLGVLRTDARLEPHQQAAINAALNLRTFALQPEPSTLTDVIEEICPTR